MAEHSQIEWTDATWNPTSGCTRVSPGCAHCYIERTPPFRIEGRRFTHGADGATTGVRLHPDRLEQPLRWRKPRRVFVNSLSDLFHEDVPDEFVTSVFDMMSLAPQHVFQVLTKRPERAREFLQGWYDCDHGGSLVARCRYCEPLPNVWLGVSIENARYTWRADVLREIPAAVRFISAEPLLGSLFVPGSSAAVADTALTVGQAAPRATASAPPVLSETVGERQGRQPGTKTSLSLEAIDWVIVGGESGPGARPMKLVWVDDILANAREHCVAPFVKQLGAVWAKHVRAEYGLHADAKGGDWQHWPERLRVREFPASVVPA